LVGFQQSAKAFIAGDLTTIVNLMHRFDYSAKGLMNPFVMIISGIHDLSLGTISTHAKEF
jgi:hypothetical protein